MYVQGNRSGEDWKENVERLMAERGLTARDVQQRLGFAERRPIYFWISGKNLLSIDSLFTLADMLSVSMEDVLIAKEEYANRHHDETHGRINDDDSKHKRR